MKRLIKRLIKSKLFLICALFGIWLMPNCSALAEFNPNFIISDRDLLDYNSMNINQIDNFLKKYDSRLSTYVDPNLRWTASYTIDYFSRYHQINPKYILVLLQKEQSLITDDSPSQDQLDWATGYGICDNCKKTDDKVQKYKGFVNQIDWGAGGTRFYFDNPNGFKFQIGQTYNIDGSPVIVTNHATRSLYTYTPHLEGNENFFNIWQKWFSTSYLNGALLQSIEDGGIWLIRDGMRHPFLSKAAYLSRYGSFDLTVPTAPADLDKYPIGSAIEFPNYSLLQIPTGGIYLLDDDTLRPISSKETFKLLGFNPEEVISVKNDDIFPYKIGAPITEESAYPTGALLQDKKSGGVYFVQNGVKKPILGRSLLKLYYTNRKLIPSGELELEKYKTGEPVKLKDGELVVGESTPTVYFISDGMRRPFGAESDFLGLGYKFNNVVKVEDKVLALHEEGSKISLVE